MGCVQSKKKKKHSVNLKHSRYSSISEEVEPKGIFSHPDVKDPVKRFPISRTHMVFISHRGPDAKIGIAQPTCWFLRNILKIEAFVDSDMLPGNNQNLALLEGLYSSTHGLMILSKNFMNSKYCKEEMDILLRRRDKNPANKQGSGVKIIPVLWRINSMEGYPKRMQEIIPVKGITMNEKDFMVQHLWPALVKEFVPEDKRHKYSTHVLECAIRLYAMKNYQREIPVSIRKFADEASLFSLLQCVYIF
mmetsp:Transcript_19801/g.28625  ORF Transcript_19801/g.28625 Transcript_19801/m.28625 type:complete len:248 (-) Transcript_19801:87-830(-)